MNEEQWISRYEELNGEGANEARMIYMFMEVIDPEHYASLSESARMEMDFVYPSFIEAK